MKSIGGRRKATLYVTTLIVISACLSVVKGQGSKDTMNARESKLILRMTDHKRAAEQYVAWIKALYAHQPTILSEVQERYLVANSKFNAFVDTLGLYLVNNPKDVQSDAFKDLTNEAERAAEAFRSYAKRLIEIERAKRSATKEAAAAAVATTGAPMSPLFGSEEDKWKWIENLPKIYKVAVDIFNAEKNRKREARVLFVSNMKQQTLWREWSRIDPAL